jgi:hypothetical protein
MDILLTRPGTILARRRSPHQAARIRRRRGRASHAHSTTSVEDHIARWPGASCLAAHSRLRAPVPGVSQRRTAASHRHHAGRPGTGTG